MKIKNIDHIVIPVSDIDKSLHFYTEVLGMEADTSNQRFAVKFGNYNPQIEMFAHFKTKSSFHKTKGII